MSSIEYASKQPSPFNGLPDPRFFYGNLYSLEVLAALRFGIEARRGLILFTGDAGTGKSVVLHELARELNSNVAFIPLADPHVRFTELLRLILRHMEVEAEAEDEPALIRCCKTAVRSRLDANQIVSLAFDDAQDLSDEVIESLTNHFLGKGFDPDNNLLQIVLAGRPELRKRLLVPPLRSLDTQVEIECRLEPLDLKDVGLYVKHRLWAADLPAEMFDDDAIEHIAIYSDGRPGAVNAICDCALKLADSSPLSKITSDVIGRAAKELKLGKPDRTGNSKKPVDKTSGGQPTTVVAGTFRMFTDVKEGKRSLSPAKGNRRTISVLLVLILLAGSAVWLHGDSAISYVRELSTNLNELVGSKPQTSARQKIQVDIPPTTAPQGLTSAPGPNADVPMAQSDQPETSDLPFAKMDKSAELAAPVPMQDPSSSNSESLQAPVNRGRQESSRKDAAQQRRDLAVQISKAIRNRAILGVDVSVSDGIAYLDGRVATPEQRNAAERAARGVPEVQGIRNRIAIE